MNRYRGEFVAKIALTGREARTRLRACRGAIYAGRGKGLENI